MPKAKFEMIYYDLKNDIETGSYSFQTWLPSENELVKLYNCSRNTIRRAVYKLIEEGSVQAIHGKGVQVIYQPIQQTAFTIGGIESFKESALRNKKNFSTKVIKFEEIVSDEVIAKKTGFPAGNELYSIKRVRFLNGKPLIMDINLFLKSSVPDLTPQIAETSIYEYIENTLHMSIVTSKRQVTVERAKDLDKNYLELNDYDCMAVITGQTYNSEGIMFEYTQSRHRPDYFCFYDTAIRRH